MKKKILLISISIFVLVISFIFGYPKIKEQQEIKKIEKEVLMVSNYLEKREGNLEEIKEFIKQDITTGERKELEKNIDEKLNQLILLDEEIQEVFIDEKLNNLLSLDTIKEDKTKYIEEKRNELNNSLKNYQELQEQEIQINLKNNQELYQKLMGNQHEIEKKLQKIEEQITKLDEEQKILDCLNKKTRNWNISDEKVVFLKRKDYLEYEKITKDLKNTNNLIVYQLVSDQKAPQINAKDLTIYKGSKINLNDKIKCIDNVDDEVKCHITGSYDVNKIGAYKINIEASDLANNKSSKTIKLNVKKKPSNKKPYYVEVIRNHNIVIVYGLDNDNNYTKIVKVFVCSVGINGKTPTGTFKTSDKSSWGWLVGNVYGQYYTRITGNILFHSVPYFKKAKNQLEWEEYNKLGTAASKGCVRLAVSDVKWIYNNCPRGTTVKIYDGNIPSGVKKPSAKKIDGSSPNRGWDPTDPDKKNPWKK